MGTSVIKALLTMEDIASGVGIVEQKRAGQTLQLHRVELAVAVHKEADVASLNTELFTYARVGEVFYRFDSLATKGLKSTFAAGFWQKVRVPMEAYASTSLPDAVDFAYMQVALTDPDGKASPVVYSTGTKWVYLDNTDV